jgi:hypothetical protein
MQFLGKNIDKKELLEKIGSVSQLGGISSFEYNDGVSKGIRTFNIKCICGMDITILADRGLDISHLFYRSIPLNWNSASGETSPYYFDDKGFGWLRSFYGGLLTTCGLTNIGDPCTDKGEEPGLHGRISNTPFEKIGICEKWIEDDYEISVQGRTKEALFKGNKIEMSRKITMFMFDPRIILEDTVTNIGYKDSPIMILYHINIGYPLLDNTSELLFKSLKTTPLDEKSKRNIESCSRFSNPVIDFEDIVLFHEIQPDNDGNSNIAMVNKTIDNDNGLGLWVKFNKDNLPYLTQWKHLEKGEYVLGIEPCNSFVRGRATERKENNLQFIRPGEQKTYRLEFNILKSNDDISKFRNTFLI